MYENFERYDMLKCYILANENSQAASELYFNTFPERRQPDNRMFQTLKSNLINYGSFKKSRARHNNLNQENEIQQLNVIGEVLDHPNTSSRTLANITDVPKTTVLETLAKHKFKPYRTRRIHQLREGDAPRRLRFCQWFVGKCREDVTFPLNVVWTDEARVDTSGIFNRYNSYHWCTENPRVVVPQNRQGRSGFNIWVGIFRGRFLGPHFYEGNLTANSFVNILRTYIVPFLEDLPLAVARNIYYQQDGCPPHNARITTDLLNEEFGQNWIGTRGPISWPARSCDLTPLDFFLWGRLKDLIFKGRAIETREELREATRQAFAVISPVELINSSNSVRRRCLLCIQQGGVQFEHLR